VTGIPCEDVVGVAGNDSDAVNEIVRTCSVCTVLGVNSASGAMNPTVP